MTNRATMLKKQALERWSYVPKDEQKKLIEELSAWPRGQAVIELDEKYNHWGNGKTSLHCNGKVVPLTFGIDRSRPYCRYLSLNDIPKPA